jgi:hypothetical protein
VILPLEHSEVWDFVGDISVRGPRRQTRLHQGWSRLLERAGGQQDRINALQCFLQRIRRRKAGSPPGEMEGLRERTNALGRSAC